MMMMKMKTSLWSLLCCSSLLLADVLATYHLTSGDPQQLIAAQSFAQSRDNGRPPFRTLNPAIHRSDYTYRGGYHYHFQPPRIPPPVVYQPIPLSPPMTYHRPSVHMPPYHHHRFTGPVVAPHTPHIYKGLSPPVAYQPHQRVKGPFPYKVKGPCPTHRTVTTTPVVNLPTDLPTQPESTLLPTLPASTVAPQTTTVLPVVVVTTVQPAETSAPVTLPVSTQSGLITTVSPGLDPCAMGHDCEHICVNSNASYNCKCRNGYILNVDKRTCSLKQVMAAVVEDPCKCEARLAFQKQMQAAVQQLTSKLADVSGRIEHLENMVGRA
uniref:matrilin-3a isoform X2 n=1 Tax=Solea senegalensis TaxID=28829 RepID=UPI001CD8F4EB|nr:matrilin-3a isoform X2 [Solea senegalensis]